MMIIIMVVIPTEEDQEVVQIRVISLKDHNPEILDQELLQMVDNMVKKLITGIFLLGLIISIS